MIFTQLFALFSFLAAQAAADCTRQQLQRAVDKYIATVKSGKVGFATASNFKYTENNKALRIAQSVLSKPIALAYDRSLLDTVNCATFSELIAPNNSPAYVLATQMRLDPKTEQVSKIDTVVSRKGSWIFNATATLRYAQTEDHGPLPPEKRSSRAALRAAADGYMDAFTDPDAYKRTPWGVPCSRVEGGIRAGPDCKLGLFPPRVKRPTTMTNRRYVIDETVSSIDVMVNFMGSPDSHEFRLVDGKIRYVRAFLDVPGMETMAEKMQPALEKLDLSKLLSGVSIAGYKLKDIYVEGLERFGSVSKIFGGKPPSA